MTLQPDVFEAAFAAWKATLREEAVARTGIEQPILSIDGKTARRSHDHAQGLKAMHCVSVWAGEYGLCLGQLACAEKSNEITAIPEVLKTVDIQGAIVTIDAMGTQTAIAAAIIAKKGDHVLALKGNQPTLQEAVIAAFEGFLESSGASQQERVTTQRGHGRSDPRVYLQIAVPPGLAGSDRWRGLKSIGMVTNRRQVGGKEATEVRYFLSSLGVDVKNFERAVRGHWSIENACHWCLDVTFGEDQSRLREHYLRENFAGLNRLALSLLKQHPGRQSVAMKRRSCGWSDKFLMDVVTTSTRYFALTLGISRDNLTRDLDDPKPPAGRMQPTDARRGPWWVASGLHKGDPSARSGMSVGLPDHGRSDLPRRASMPSRRIPDQPGPSCVHMRWRSHDASKKQISRRGVARRCGPRRHQPNRRSRSRPEIQRQDIAACGARSRRRHRRAAALEGRALSGRIGGSRLHHRKHIEK